MKTLICCIAKLENFYLREWVEWYKNIGITNICLFDNNDIDGEHFEDVIGDYIDSGFVIVKDVRGMEKMQLPCYQMCYNEFNQEYDWIGFFDADEYLEIENGTITDFLSRVEYNDVGAIRVCWKNFDDNDLLTVEDNNYSIERFTRVIDPNHICNRTSKVIIRGGQSGLEIYQKPGGAHGQFLNCKTVDVLGNIHNNLHFVLHTNIWKIAWLRHYRFKTIEEYVKLKLDRLYPDVDKEIARKWLDINSFWDYNKKTKEKEIYFNKYINQKIGCFIFNYNKDDNAKIWYDRLNFKYPTYILDTFHKQNGTHFLSENETVIEYDNIFCGGLTKKAYEISKKMGYEWVLIANSDVVCNDYNYNKLTEVISELISKQDIGVWDPSACFGSMVNGSTGRINDNKHLYYQGTNQPREVKSGEGWFEIISIHVMDMVMPYTDYEENKYGWGMNDAFNRAARKLKLKVVVDDRVIMYHPFGTGYNNFEASEEYQRFKLKFQEMGLNEIEMMNKNDLMTLICCIGKNENRYVREYVEYYKKLGVTHIRIYDNNDIDGEHFEDVIGDYIDSGFVSIIDYRGRKFCQLQSYQECYDELGCYYDWIMFIDCGDEYLTLINHNNISEFLSSECFNNYDLIHINLMTFGDSDKVEDSNELLQTRFTKPIPFDKCIAYKDIPENCHISSIVRGGLKDVYWRMTPHTPYPCKLNSCNDNGEPTRAEIPLQNISYKQAFFRHYTTKTAYEYCNKMKRGFPDSIVDEKRIKILVETRFFGTNKVTQEKIDIFKRELGIDMSYLLPSTFEGEKRKDVQIFSLCYDKKNFSFLNNEIITPLQVGAANGKDVCVLKDNTGDNISHKNYFYIENTGTYWIWKNVKDAKYKGQIQYRRPFEGLESNIDFDKLFNDFDVITCVPFNHPANSRPTEENPMFIPANTVEEGYAFSNCIDDLYIIEMIINLYYPEYKESYNKYIKNGEDLYYSNGFIMRAEDYDRYCEFLFDCLAKYEQFVDVSTPEKLRERVTYHMGVGKYPKHMDPKTRTKEAIRWQMSIGGFLSERLWTLWLLHNFKNEKIMKIPYIKMEEGMYT